MTLSCSRLSGGFSKGVQVFAHGESQDWLPHSHCFGLELV